MFWCWKAPSWPFDLKIPGQSNSLDLEIAYEFWMEIGPCAIGYRCPALVEVRKFEGVVRLVGTESSGRVFFFSLGNWRGVITLSFHTHFHEFVANFGPWEDVLLKFHANKMSRCERGLGYLSFIRLNADSVWGPWNAFSAAVASFWRQGYEIPASHHTSIRQCPLSGRVSSEEKDTYSDIVCLSSSEYRYWKEWTSCSIQSLIWWCWRRSPSRSLKLCSILLPNGILPNSCCPTNICLFLLRWW